MTAAWHPEQPIEEWSSADETQGDDPSDILALPGHERYTIFLTQVTAQGRVWALKGEGGFVAFRDDDGQDCLPFWPDAVYADALANEDWADCRAEPLDLGVFMDRWLPGMIRDERLVAVFPAPDGSGTVIDPAVLLEDLREEHEATGG